MRWSSRRSSTECVRDSGVTEHSWSPFLLSLLPFLLRYHSCFLFFSVGCVEVRGCWVSGQVVCFACSGVVVLLLLPLIGRIGRGALGELFSLVHPYKLSAASVYSTACSSSTPSHWGLSTLQIEHRTQLPCTSKRGTKDSSRGCCGVMCYCMLLLVHTLRHFNGPHMTTQPAKRQPTHSLHHSPRSHLHHSLSLTPADLF